MSLVMPAERLNAYLEAIEVEEQIIENKSRLNESGVVKYWFTEADFEPLRRAKAAFAAAWDKAMREMQERQKK